MKVLVTGGTGMIGRWLQVQVAYLPYTEHEYVFIGSKECDLTDYISTMKYFAEHGAKFDAIIHLAAAVGGLYKNMRANSDMYSLNQKINLNVLEACKRHHINRGIFCLSSCIFPAHPSGYPMFEEQIDERPPHASNEGYALAKRGLAKHCEFMNKEHGTQFICLSPVNMYGPYDNFNLEDSHVIPGLVHRMYNYKQHRDANENYDSEYPDEMFHVYGSGKALRQFVFAPDFATLILRFLCDTDITKGIYNICEEREYTIREIVYKLADLMDVPREKILFDKNYSDGVLKKTVSNYILKKQYPKFGFIPIDSGLTMTVEWFNKNYDTART